MIEARIFFVGKGSATLLRLGDRRSGRFGIIDCYCGDDRRSPIPEYFNAMESDLESIEFIVITHPHRDHFLGVSRLLSTYSDRIRKYFDSGLNPKSVIIADYPSNSHLDTTTTRELLAIEKYCLRRCNRPKIGVISTPGTVIYRDPAEDIVVESVAPPGYVSKTMEGKLHGYVQRCKRIMHEARRNGTAYEMPPRPGRLDLNEVSSAIKITHHGKMFVVGGDVLRHNWKYLLENSCLPADAILLSHHGSHTGFPKTYWGDGFGKRDAAALVSGEGAHQPSESVVRTLAKYGCALYCTGSDVGFGPHRQLYNYVRALHYGQKLRHGPRKDLIVNIDQNGITVEMCAVEI